MFISILSKISYLSKEYSQKLDDTLFDAANSRYHKKPINNQSS